ncbi:hypothetical protein C8J57DRAFT_1057203 [Mycena rebaudengoi]|nr:hypothetical protein C8J57DRAFT_1057203 [Mycena rebaudengoi]
MESIPAADAPTLYAVLGVDKSASADEIRRAYRLKALETHPDKLDPNASPEEKQAAEAKFHEARRLNLFHPLRLLIRMSMLQVHEAFEILRDGHKRRKYDVQRGFRPHVPKSQWSQFSEEQARRMKDREEWARKQHEQYEERLRGIRARAEAERQEMLRRQREMAEYALMVERMLAELYKKNPEWEARKERARKVWFTPFD